MVLAIGDLGRGITHTHTHRMFIKYIVFSKDFKYIPDSGLSLFSLGVSKCTPDFTLGPPDGRQNTSAAAEHLK